MVNRIKHAYTQTLLTFRRATRNNAFGIFVVTAHAKNSVKYINNEEGD